jgi:magnesium-transporting ATPase (P-type)
MDAADVFSIMLSMCPFVIFKSIGSWSTTRNIFPAKSVLCNFGGAFMWAIYMNFQKYLSYGYSGLDASWVNCLSMAFNVAVRLAYFKDGKEYLKVIKKVLLCVVSRYTIQYHVFFYFLLQFTMSLLGSVGLAVVFIVILVFPTLKNIPIMQVNF